MASRGLRLADADAGVPPRLVRWIYAAAEPIGVSAVDESGYPPAVPEHLELRAKVGRLGTVQDRFVAAAVRILELDGERERHAWSIAR